jgi:hypothetical protein
LALKLGAREGRAWLMTTHLGLEPCWGELDARHLRGGAGNVAMRAGLRPTAKAVATPPDATAGAPALYPTIRGWGASHRAGTKVNARWPRKVATPEAEPASVGRRQYGAPPADVRGGHSGGVISDGTMTRTRRATGEALLVPPRKRRSQVRPITTTNGKGAEGERVAEGPAVARKGGNAPGAMGPCCSAMPPTTWKAGATG